MKIRNILSRYWPLLLVLLLGAGLRFYGLLQNPISLFSDEVDIGYQVQSFLSNGRDYQGNFLPLQFHSFSDVRTALPIYATALVSLLPNVSLDLAIRLTPALFAILGLLVIYLLANNLSELFGLGSKAAPFNLGFWSALILSVIPWHFTYSRIGFELSMLFTFYLTGLFFYTRFLRNQGVKNLIVSIVLFSLTPLIYSTAKLALIFVPVVLITIPGSNEYLWGKKISLWFLLLFIPLGLIFVNGGAAQRFSEISIFTDPTTPTEIDFLRKEDLGPKAPVGSQTYFLSKAVHNKVIYPLDVFLKNVVRPISFDYLFLQGDTNPRHAVQGWGMLEKALLIPLLFGLYKLAEGKQKRFLIFLSILTVAAIIPSALTRDGATHSSRTFMLILPLVLVISFGFYNLFSSSRWLTALVLGLLMIDSSLYLHDYWYHYRYTSERSWSAGMKDLMQSVSKHPGQPVVISPKYEYPLIFYLYYNGFEPRKFQDFERQNTVYNSTSGNFNLDGNRIGDSNLYIASLVDYKNKPTVLLPNAVYYLTRSEVDTSAIGSVATIGDIISLPSGEPLYYEVHY
ncbi:TPA: hypothetical protein DIU27_00765 [Candidatus Collierbacteria bacterium]|uniref:Glycosyl transferase family 39 n=1 Tax=Candidatus Collierbacteria bacterium GW2011_GWB2_44_22 TaxID=1618387 RepID=A0A0G1KWZ6_9BACT|nr:MAG: Glycosyl transferase family 39 [Candidatus Collierbacteria bacterium GW2011_GWA2_44_13]KKT49987.1 MAG: Glycosyl transferase family 39 [Candidatus Collierbacteria bacterium GW2011_GWB1_44_197]KKT52464.1 MAG: Glycosyl transferase family 39 [Candidatus Collierbacteria bacterium GW2011_GWB2_44_22]KKT61727.1 MAG: Glycosyl transferase family 39 [Candidatus Collierbacteria bacterium GW2011_GWD1_44_27]KKT65534.1 MAG: Glycosyl transferase family 39 [Candidatus Collierbacteria bacterium GW2011_GW